MLLLGIVLTILFAVLKLVGVIAWPWLVVCVPLIVVAAVALVLFGDAVLCMVWRLTR